MTSEVENISFKTTNLNVQMPTFIEWNELDCGISKAARIHLSCLQKSIRWRKWS